MLPTNKVVNIDRYKQHSEQEVIDDIGAQAFQFMRDAAEEMGVPVKAVVIEHMLGLALVMSSVEGEEEAQKVLKSIGVKLSLNQK